MATAEQTIMRRDKGNGETSRVSREFALDRLGNFYQDPTAVLDAATETYPIATPFAVYWPEAARTAKTAGEQIANAITMAIRGDITQSQLATAIDTALRSYR